MTLTQADRISISKKIVDIPRLNAIADKTKEELSKVKAQFVELDNTNKSLADAQTTLINTYQLELNRYDGNQRTELAEQDIVDSVNRVKNNPFFPNDNLLPLPNLASGVWINFIPYSFTKAIGRKFDESFDIVTKEQDLIDAVLAAITVVEGFSDPTRSTGEKCISGICSIPIYETQVTCEANAGIWTPGDDIITDSDMQAAGTDLINAVQAWEDFINTTHGLVPTIDTDVARSAQNDASRNDITNAISAINTWQAYPNYDTTHGAGTCAAFNSLNVSLLDQTKFRADSIAALAAELSARQVFISTRVSQISGHLGSVSQNTTTGSIISTSGFYGTRFRFIDLRLNAMAGSLTRLNGLAKGEEAQDQAKEANNNAAAAYSSVLRAVAFRSPAINTTSVHVLDATGFNIGDSVYVVSDTQAEISAMIESIDTNRIVLDKTIPEKYRQTELARLYKVL